MVYTLLILEGNNSTNKTIRNKRRGRMDHGKGYKLCAIFPLLFHGFRG